AFGAITSSPAALVLQSPPVSNNPPQPVAVPAGSNAVFVVGASGSLPLYFQWQHNGATLPGATSYSWTISHVQPGDAGIYSITITNTFGSVTSSQGVLTVQLPVTITNQPLSESMPAGSNDFFSVGPGGAGPFKYQWRVG